MMNKKPIYAALRPFIELNSAKREELPHALFDIMALDLLSTLGWIEVQRLLIQTMERLLSGKKNAFGRWETWEHIDEVCSGALAFSLNISTEANESKLVVVKRLRKLYFAMPDRHDYKTSIGISRPSTLVEQREPVLLATKKLLLQTLGEYWTASLLHPTKAEEGIDQVSNMAFSLLCDICTQADSGIETIDANQEVCKPFGGSVSEYDKYRRFMPEEEALLVEVVTERAKLYSFDAILKFAHQFLLPDQIKDVFVAKLLESSAYEHISELLVAKPEEKQKVA